MTKPNTDRNDRLFDQATIRAVWLKGRTVSGYDSNLYRIDPCGAWMEYTEHGNVNHVRGWEIDHISPKAAGGGDDIPNLQPLHWKNNRIKGDSTGGWSCAVAA